MSTYGGYETNAFLATLYDLVTAYRNRPDISFYVEQCRRADGIILELGCGTGRILIPVAEAGCDIIGIDLSKYMLSRCAEKVEALPDDVRRRIRLIRAGMTQFAVNERFKLIMIPFHAFQHIIAVDEQMSCLQNIHAHLVPGGRLIFDVFNVKMDRITNPAVNEEQLVDAEVEIPGGRRMSRGHRIVLFHRAEQYNQVELIYYVKELDGEVVRHVQSFPMRYFFRYEVEHLLARCGFEIVELYGAFDGSPYMDDSPEMIFIAEKK